MIGHATSSSGDSGYHSPDTSSVDLTVTESEPPLLVQSATDSSNITTLSVPEGSSSSSDFASYKVKLSAQPSSNVTVYLDLQSTSGNNAGDSSINRSPSSLTFTTLNWNEAKEVKVWAGEDSDNTAGTRTITHRVSGGGYSTPAPSSSPPPRRRTTWPSFSTPQLTCPSPKAAPQPSP